MQAAFPRRLASLLPLLIITAIVWLPVEAFAGVGGAFLKTAKHSRVVQILLLLAAVLLFPVLVYVTAREALAVRRTKADLAQLSQRLPFFAWTTIEQQTIKAVTRLHDHWSSGDLSPCHTLMTQDYFESQTALLERWTEEGRRNVVQLETISSVRPLNLNTGDESGLSPHIWISVQMKLVDYLEEISTGKVVKGKKNETIDHEVLYQMAFANDGWRVNAIEEGSSSLVLASQKNVVDVAWLEKLFEARVHVPSNATSKSTAPHATQNEGASEIKEPGVAVADDNA